MRHARTVPFLISCCLAIAGCGTDESHEPGASGQASSAVKSIDDTYHQGGCDYVNAADLPDFPVYSDSATVMLCPDGIGQPELAFYRPVDMTLHGQDYTFSHIVELDVVNVEHYGCYYSHDTTIRARIMEYSVTSTWSLEAPTVSAIVIDRDAPEIFGCRKLLGVVPH